MADRRLAELHHCGDLGASLAACTAGGGTVLSAPRGAGGTARFAVIRDPAGAAVALFESGAE